MDKVDELTVKEWHTNQRKNEVPASGNTDKPLAKTKSKGSILTDWAISGSWM